VKAVIDNRMLFSKSVAHLDKAKGRLDSKTPSQSDKKDNAIIKLDNKKVTSKNIFSANIFQPQIGITFKK
jgi:hypothetical protein